MNEMSTKKYAFVLGREKELCLSELRAVLDRFGFYFDELIVSDNVAFINLAASPKDVAMLLNVLAGTIKIFEVFGDAGRNDAKLIASYISEHQKRAGKFNFGISSFGPFEKNVINKIGLDVKRLLKGNINTRFVALRDGKELSSILSVKEKLVDSGFEFGLFKKEIGVLIALNNPEEWNKRDYDKPAGDKRSGMLPPKLARMMINIALGASSNNQLSISNQASIFNGHNENSEIDNSLEIGERTLVIDPFCGSGNVVLEAMMLGLNVFASDISERAVRDTKANVEWLRQNHQTNSKAEILGADATSMDFSRFLGNYENFLVVSEPYLGEPKKFKPSINAAKGEYAKIKEMYLGFLRNIAKINHSNHIVLCLVFPLVETIEGKRFSLYRDCVDEIVKMGYIVSQSPLVYGRDYQVVKREIALLVCR